MKKLPDEISKASAMAGESSASWEPAPNVVGVREAKARLSSLLDEAAAGREILITSGGRPKARLVSLADAERRRPFRGSREHLATMPPWHGGKPAEAIIREERDSRG